MFENWQKCLIFNLHANNRFYYIQRFEFSRQISLLRCFMILFWHNFHTHFSVLKISKNVSFSVYKSQKSLFIIFKDLNFHAKNIQNPSFSKKKLRLFYTWFSNIFLKHSGVKNHEFFHPLCTRTLPSEINFAPMFLFTFSSKDCKEGKGHEQNIISVVKVLK